MSGVLGGDTCDRRAEQNIYDPTNADSDDDEWQGSDTDEEEEEVCQNEIEMYSTHKLQMRSSNSRRGRGEFASILDLLRLPWAEPGMDIVIDPAATDL
ncbi:hypothetical protein Tco_0943450 [Tanacetum coccineum]